MSISTLESTASVRALDAMYAEADERAEMQAYYAERFAYEVRHGQAWQETDLSKLRHRYTSGQPERVLRRQTLVELLTDRLGDGMESYDEPTIEQAVSLLLAAARGKDIAEDARTLFDRMATLYGKERAEGAL